MKEDRKKELMGRFLTFLREIFEEGLEDEINEEDENLIESYAKHVLQATNRAMLKGQTEGYQPIFNISLWVKPKQGGLSDFSYSFESIGDEPFARFRLSDLAQKLDVAFGEWQEENWGELTEVMAEKLESWGHLISDTMAKGV